MRFGQNARVAGRTIKAFGVALALFAAPQAAFAQDAAAVASPAASAAASEAAPAAAPAAVAADAAPAAAPATAAPAFDANDPRFKIAEGGYTPMVPTAGKGMPVDKGIALQDQYSPNGDYARWMHDAILMPVIVAISLLVLFLLIYIIGRYNKRANPVASKTSHNTLLEVIWTGVPVLILVAIAVPSITLIAKQFKPAPAKALTIKATGNQWYWTYTYVDNGGFEVISNMLKEANEVKGDERARTDADGPSQLAVDYRMVVPAGEPIRLEVTAADVIHSFAVPSLWFKIDGVPGRINQKVLFIKEPGVYFGQCSELCGVRHGYMPIAIEALPRDKYNAWVMTQSGGKLDGLPDGVEVPAPAAAAAPAVAAPAAAAPASPAPAA